MSEKQLPLINILEVLASQHRMEMLRKLKRPSTRLALQDVGSCSGRCLWIFDQAGQGLAFSTTSKYLTDLPGIGVVTLKQSGKWSDYMPNEKAIKAVVARLKKAL